MREILFKEIVSDNLRKKNTVVVEVFEKKGVLAKTERRFFYFVKDLTRIEDDTELREWIGSHNIIKKEGQKHFYIMREHNEKVGIDRVICKITGTCYAIFNNIVYTIGFLHSFKARFDKISLANK